MYLCTCVDEKEAVEHVLVKRMRRRQVSRKARIDKVRAASVLWKRGTVSNGRQGRNRVDIVRAAFILLHSGIIHADILKTL